MRPLSAQELLEVWEMGQWQAPVERAISLLSASSPDATEDTMVHLPIGERDRRLLLFRDQVFGPDLEAVASCPACGEKLETTVSSADIYGPVVAGPSTALTFQHGEYSVQFRLPDSQDIAVISGKEVTSKARDMLLERCILGATMGSVPVLSSDLPDEVVEALLEEMEKADPLANSRLSLTCPSCGAGWDEDLDILSFFWDEIENWAHRTLQEVHILASAYGWSEPEILSLSAARRKMYVDRVSE
jgi:hypothetical protein